MNNQELARHERRNPHEKDPSDDERTLPEDVEVTVTLTMTACLTLALTAAQARDPDTVRELAAEVLDARLRNGDITASDLIDDIVPEEVRDTDGNIVATDWGLFDGSYRLDVGTFGSEEAANRYGAGLTVTDWESHPVLWSR